VDHGVGLDFVEKGVDVGAVEDVEFDDVRGVDPVKACADGFPPCAGELALDLTA
jgi:hypothetical protein